MESREREPSVAIDVIAVVMSTGALAFGWWAWL